MSFLSNIRNAAIIGMGGVPTRPAMIAEPNSKAAARNLSTIISPVQLQRLRHDVQMWREAMSEAELAWYPHRVRMQRMFIDTILNGHAFSVMERRKDLTLLRDFKLCDKKDVKSDVLTQYFQEQDWFIDHNGYALDALFFGYSLISLGDVVNDAFPNLSIVRRWNISPDRLNVTRFVYSIDGTPFLEEPYKDWHIWVDTPTESGATNCGYGLFYKMGLYEIILRNTLGFNADFVELYAMPYRVGKTTKTTEDERAELETAVRNMGSAGYAILDPMDEIDFLETNLGGTGWQSYDNLEKRCNQAISKIVMGHADALDSIPGKLGSQSGDDNPIIKAMTDKQTKDGRFLQSLINKQLLPRMRNLGFDIPADMRFVFNNDDEKEALRCREDESNKKTADIYKVIKDAGGRADWKYFTDRTGIPVEEAPDPVQMLPTAEKEDGKAFSDRVQNKLNNLYK